MCFGSLLTWCCLCWLSVVVRSCRRIHNRRKGDVEHLTIFPEAMLEVLKSEDSDRDVCMTMAVFPQELLTLVAFPEHAAPYYSSVSVTFGPVRFCRRRWWRCCWWWWWC